MYLRQPCPNCGTSVEFVYEQIGHGNCCKHCNYEFTLEPKRKSVIPFLIWASILLAVAVVGFFTIKTFHDWWIYR